MTAKGIERVAYIAAHRIVEANTVASGLACPGARRSRAVDAIADIIREVLELHSAGSDDRIEREIGSILRVMNARRDAGVVQLTPRTYPDEVA